MPTLSISIFFFFNDTATTEIYTLPLHDALPISGRFSQRRTPLLPRRSGAESSRRLDRPETGLDQQPAPDRKSTRLNSNHSQISYAVFCLKKKKNDKTLIY